MGPGSGENLSRDGGPLGWPGRALEAGLEGWGRVRVWRGLGDGTGEVGLG